MGVQTPLTKKPYSEGTEACHVCGGRIQEIVEFSHFSRVSSDCKILPPGGCLAYCTSCGGMQKPLSEKFLSEISDIYDDYDVYYQSGGIEQIIFDKRTGQPRRRSDTLADRLMATGLLPETGHAIDLGCGNGTFLRALSNRLPTWRFNALELSRRHETSLAMIRGFEKLIVGQPERLTGTYDLVCMIHALEHFPTPSSTLKAVAARLAPKGHIFIQIPNVEQNPFDLLIADHVLHLSPQSLKAFLMRQGFEIASLETDWVMKEISVLARCASVPQEIPEPPKDRDTCFRHVHWLEEMLSRAHEAAKHKPFGLFGTSIAATWLAGALDDQIDFYVDEDPSRRQQLFLGKPVVKPEEIPEGSNLFVGLAPVIAKIIANKLRPYNVSVIMPPELPPI